MIGELENARDGLDADGVVSSIRDRKFRGKLVPELDDCVLLLAENRTNEETRNWKLKNEAGTALRRRTSIQRITTPLTAHEHTSLINEFCARKSHVFD